MFKVVADFIALGSLFRSGMLPNLLVPSSEVPRLWTSLGW